MAYRRVSLPVIKLTKRPTVGGKSLQFIHPDIPADPASVQSEIVDETTEEPRVTEDFSAQNNIDPFLLDSTSDTAEPTLHELEAKATAAGWQRIRNEILNIVTENAAMPVGQVCSAIFALITHCFSLLGLYKL